MKIIVTVKTGKGLNSTRKEIDKTVDVALTAGELIYNKYHLKICKCKCMSDGTRVILEK